MLGSQYSKARMTLKEKNWSPFVANVAGPGDEKKQPRDLLVYSIEPHVVLELDVNQSQRRAAIRRSWNTTAPEVWAWFDDRVEEDFSTEDLSAGPAMLHTSSGPVPMAELPGYPDVFLSVLHTNVLTGEYFTAKESRGWPQYLSYFYTFEKHPPFRILNVSKNAIPLKKLMGWNGTENIAFITQLMWVNSTDKNNDTETKLWVMYGAGDVESRRAIISQKQFIDLELLPVDMSSAARAVCSWVILCMTLASLGRH
jgi:hypothetical protein